MADEQKDKPVPAKTEKATAEEEGSGTATAKPAAKPKRARSTTRKSAPKKRPPQPLPPWKVLLHNDDKNSFDRVIGAIVELTPLNEQDAKLRADEAHDTGVALLLTTHKERAELYQEQFTSKGLVVTIEPAE